jgi:hypothetical protein
VIPEEFAHGFTTRAGGVSAAPFDTLNLGTKWGDDPARVEENRRRLLAAAAATRLFVAKQVHGAAVVRVRADADPDAIAAASADALCTDVPGHAVAVFVADCVPLLLADPGTGACAAVHAGWRGVVGGVGPAALARLAADFGTRPGDVRVALGPSIGPCCFEVGPEVEAAFRSLVPEATSLGIVRDGGSGKAHVDLRAALRWAFVQQGVPGSAIDAEPPCTRCDPERFYSYRRDGARTGQHVGFVVRRGPVTAP